MRRRYGVAGLAVITSVATIGGIFGAETSEAQTTQPCTDNSSQCMISAASQYINALISHNPASVPFAPNVRRTENGTDTGDGAASLRKQMTPPTDLQLNIDVRDVRWYPDTTDNDVVAFYVLDNGLTASAPLATTFVSERFQVIGGLIYQIEADYSISFTKNAPSPW